MSTRKKINKTAMLPGPGLNTRRARKCVYLEGRSGSFDPHVELCANKLFPMKI